MNRKQEYDFCAKAENQTPRGRGLRRDESLTEIVPVCFEADVIEEVRRRGRRRRVGVSVDPRRGRASTTPNGELTRPAASESDGIVLGGPAQCE